MFVPDTNVYEAYLTGDLSIIDFTNETKIRAKLGIGSSSSPVLTDTLRKMTIDRKELSRFSQDMSSDPNMTWDSLAPIGMALISFPSTNVYLYADLRKSQSKLFLCAHVDNLGDATLYARPDETGDAHSYFFSATCKDLGLIWSQLGQPVMSTFSFSQIVAQIIGYNGRVGTLLDELIAF